LGFLKILASLYLLGSPTQVPDADGWVSVERREKRAEEFEDEKGVWVVVSKEIGPEHFFVGFPEDPKTRTVDGKVEWTASSNHDLLSLRVEKRDAGKEGAQFFDERLFSLSAHPETFLVKTHVSANGFDLFYRQEGKWVWEKIVVTENFFYLLQTTSDQMSGDSHRKLVKSFSLK